MYTSYKDVNKLTSIKIMLCITFHVMLAHDNVSYVDVFRYYKLIKNNLSAFKQGWCLQVNKNKLSPF